MITPTATEIQQSTGHRHVDLHAERRARVHDLELAIGRQALAKAIDRVHEHDFPDLARRRSSRSQGRWRRLGLALGQCGASCSSADRPYGVKLLT